MKRFGASVLLAMLMLAAGTGLYAEEEKKQQKSFEKRLAIAHRKVRFYRYQYNRFAFNNTYSTLKRRYIRGQLLRWQSICSKLMKEAEKRN